MLKRYEEFLKEVDREISEYFKAQQQYIKCRKGCTDCCTTGEYPFSRLEAEYLMQGFQTLSKEERDGVRQNIKLVKLQKADFIKHSNTANNSPAAGQKLNIQTESRFEYRCPFLINNLCVLYSRRGLVCRMFGLAYLDENRIVLPECANSGLNYSGVFDSASGMVNLENPIQKKLTIDTSLHSPLAEKYALEAGEIRPLIDWF